MQKYYIVIPNWNGADHLRECLDSLLKQTKAASILVVDNGSVDNSVALLENDYPNVILIKHKKNRGFSGGVNAGIKYALKLNAKYIALFNNDAAADKDWLKHLAAYLDKNPKVAIATSQITDQTGKHYDSTGDFYTTWGLPFPRGRGEPVSDQYEEGLVFGASGGASLYRAELFNEIGLFDQDFFAYYEDVDLSFRAQLAGWKIAYVPAARAYHHIGATSSKISGFTTYHTLKNLPLLLWKNVPWKLMPKIYPRFFLLYWTIAGRALFRGRFIPLIKGLVVGAVLWPKKLVQRYKIQKNRKVSVDYISSIIVHDLPPNAHRLRKLRSFFIKGF